MILFTEIRGVPCKVCVTHYEPGLEPITSGHPDGWDPGYPPEIEFEVLDSQGDRNLGLESQMDDADVRTVEQEIIAAHEGRERHMQEDRAEDRWLEARGY